MQPEGAPRDLQFAWHQMIGNMFSNKTILDVGAGLGYSKERMQINGNIVTTADINRNLMNNVDVVDWTCNLTGDYDVVTTFDVIEHTPRPKEFIEQLINLSKEFVFLTTPNYLKWPHPWHFTAKEFFDICFFYEVNFKFFLRNKHPDDIIKRVEKEDFLTLDCDYFGLMIRK